jgi:NYN domain
LKSALFVDFDNVYSGLRKLDPALADRFARQPLRWIDWLLDELPPPEHAPEAARRRLLVRRVYLNPQVYQRYRPSFNHAGFEIIDCPPMTSEGKTSTDIHMVLDMVDLLQHQVHVDEFIVFSADADFTPVLRKLRRWDRRTTVLAVGFPSAAYRASADLLIDQDQFMRALGQRESDEPPAEGAMVADAAEAAGAAMPPPSAPQSASPFDLDEIARRLSHTVADSPLPIPCARLATLLMAAHPGISPDWCGQGGFRRFMEALSLAPLRLDWSASGGHLYDPARHVLPPSTRARSEADSAAWGLDPALRALARQVHDATGVPLLSPRDFRALLEAIVTEVIAQPFQLSETGKRVRDRCRDTGHEVSRESVNWVLRGLLLGGHEFGQGHDDVQTLAGRLVGNLVNLCRREQVLLDEQAPGALQLWMLGGAGAAVRPQAADGVADDIAEGAAAAASDQLALPSSARPSASATSMPSTPADMMPPA